MMIRSMSMVISLASLRVSQSFTVSSTSRCFHSHLLSQHKTTTTTNLRTILGASSHRLASTTSSNEYVKLSDPAPGSREYKIKNLNDFPFHFFPLIDIETFYNCIFFTKKSISFSSPST